MKEKNKLTGGVGERAAESYLVKKGYELIVRNFSTRMGEIDLIMLDKDIIVFVEVKAKIGERFGRPEEMFTTAKKRKVMNTATMYLKGKPSKCRIDMVAVDLFPDMSVNTLRHYENV